LISTWLPLELDAANPLNLNRDLSYFHFKAFSF
jgi:hypothetical protein